MNLATITREFKELPLGLIDAPVLPSRSQMDDQALDDLTASIGAIGLQQPMIVARVGERFEIIAGHRRFIACGRAGLVTAPCIIYPSKSDALLSIQFAENAHREALNAADEALWFAELLEQRCGGDVDQLAALMHLTRGYVEGRLLLFQGDEKVFESLRDGQIRIGVAHELNRCTDQTYRRYLLHQAIVGGATQTVVRGWIVDWQNQARAAAVGGEFAPAASAPAAIPQTNYFTCCVCGGTEHVHLMTPINVHQHCKLAILDKLLAAYRGEA